MDTNEKIILKEMLDSLINTKIVLERIYNDLMERSVESKDYKKDKGIVIYPSKGSNSKLTEDLFKRIKKIKGFDLKIVITDLDESIKKIQNLTKS